MSLASLIYVAARQSLRAFVESFAVIQLKNDSEIEGYKPHAYQSKIIEIIEWCESNSVPCRITGLKPRRGGSSTISITALYHALMKSMRRALILVGKDYQGMMMFKMLKLLADKDRTTKNRAKVLDTEARFPNGSYCVRVNASGEDAAVSGGFTFMHVTELAKWAQEGCAAASAVLSNALKCVPFLPGTVIIIESTAENSGDEFHRIYSTGITFEQLKAGAVGYVKVFAAWFEFNDHILDPKSMGIESIEDLTHEERELSGEYHLSLEQIAWMRYTIKDQCHGSFDEFKRDYPFNDTECFMLSGSKVFSMVGLKKMRDMLPSFPPIAGVIDIRDPLLLAKGKAEPAAVTFRPTSPDNCKMILIEYPTEGMKYVIGGDMMTGASSAIGENPDNHSIVVWRTGYHQAGKWYPPRSVAMLIGDYAEYLAKKKYTLIWDQDILTEEVYRLALFYGNAMVCNEINTDRGMAMTLRERGINVLVQKQWNKREQKETNSLGWKTDQFSRGKLIGELGKGIREFANFDPLTGHSKERIEIYLAPILDECEAFVRLSSGREEAMQGKKDDNVIASGIALCCLDQAITYHRPAGRADEPEWMRGSSSPTEKNQYA